MKTQNTFRLDAFRLRPLVFEAKKFKFTEGEHVLEVWLKPLGVVDRYFADDRYEELRKSYLEGGHFPLLGGKKVRLSRHLLRLAVSIESMQSEDHLENFYPADQLIGFAFTVPHLWEQIVRACEQLCGLEGGTQEWMKLIEGAVSWGHYHPELIWRQDRLLWSINERLGGHSGIELQPLGWKWLEELMSLEK